MLGLLNLPFDAKFKLVILVVISCVASRLLREKKERERESDLVDSLPDHFENVSHSKAILKIKGKYIRSRYYEGRDG